MWYQREEHSRKIGVVRAKGSQWECDWDLKNRKQGEVMEMRSVG